MLKKSILTNSFYNIVAQVLQFGFGIVLARLLFPNEFGVYSISRMVVEVSSLLTLRGFSTALIQAKEVTDENFSTVFNINISISVIVCLAICIASPHLAAFFNMPSLSFLIKWQAVVLLIMSFEIVSSVKLLRNLQFREFGLAVLWSVSANGVCSVLFAIAKFGTLSLVLGYLMENFIRVALCSFFAARGSRKISFVFKINPSVFKKMRHVGLGVTLQELFNYIATNVDYFWLGKLASAADLGFYTRAYKIMSLPVRQIGQNFSRVIMPVFSRIQDDDNEIFHKLLKINQIISLILFPALVIVYYYTSSFIFFIYGERWMPSVAPLKLLIIAGAIKAISTYLGQILKAKGIVYREVINQTIYAVTLAVGGFFAVKSAGMMGMCWVVIVASLILWVANLTLVLRALKASLYAYLSSFFPAFWGSFIVFSSCFLINHTFHFPYTNIMYFIFSSLVGVFLYIVLLFLILKKNCLVLKEINAFQAKIVSIFGFVEKSK